MPGHLERLTGRRMVRITLQFISFTPVNPDRLEAGYFHRHECHCANICLSSQLNTLCCSCWCAYWPLSLSHPHTVTPIQCPDYSCAYCSLPMRTVHFWGPSNAAFLWIRCLTKSYIICIHLIVVCKQLVILVPVYYPWPTACIAGELWCRQFGTMRLR